MIETNTSNGTMICISHCLWYMLVAGYVLPICGLLTFFIVTYFWVQEFPVGICVDVLSILKRPQMDRIIDIKETREELKQKVDTIDRYIHRSELKKQFKGLQHTPWCDKFTYPFRCPQMVILCMIYTVLQYGFAYSAFVIFSSEHAYLYFFYLSAVAIGFIANMYVFIVSFFWSFFMVGVIALTAFVIAGFVMIAAVVSSPPVLCCLLISLFNYYWNNR